MMQTLKKGPPALVLKKVGNTIRFPEKLKGTIVEKWATYWKNLFIDYHQMVQDLRNDIQEEPFKALKWTAGIAVCYALAKNNPNELDYRNEVKKLENDVALVTEECLNQNSIEHLRLIETSYNQGIIHYRSLGLLSIMYLSDISRSCDLYKSQCSYMKPSLMSYPSRIVDIGIMGKWWNLYKKTTDYDINDVNFNN